MEATRMNTNDRLRVGIVCYPTLGGSGVVATELASGLADLGHETHLFTYAKPHRDAKGVCCHIVDVVAYPLLRYPPYDLALASAIVDFVEHVRPLDVLHVHYAVPHAISAFLAKAMLGKASFATVTTLHGTDISVVGSDPAYATVTRFGIEKSDGVTAVSESLRRETIELLRIQRPIEVIPNFVDTEEFHPVARAAGAPPRLAHASNFRAVKRPLDVVRIFAKVRREVPARLSLIGDGPELPAALDLAKNLGVFDAIDVHGPIAVPARELAMADVLLLPSELESFGLSALEALACGVPVVATNIGGIPEVVDHGRTGFLSPLGDVDSMARATVSLLRDAKMREAFGAAGRESALSRFSEGSIVDRYVRHYRATIERRATIGCASAP
jgi:N-acetyl-alpha-D-glucosaminyl L-malate synthase BshA